MFDGVNLGERPMPEIDQGKIQYIVGFESMEEKVKVAELLISKGILWIGGNTENKSMDETTGICIEKFMNGHFRMVPYTCDSNFILRMAISLEGNDKYDFILAKYFLANQHEVIGLKESSPPLLTMFYKGEYVPLSVFKMGKLREILDILREANNA